MPACPKPTKQKKSKRTSRSERKVLEKEIEKLMRELVWWRDGYQCVLKDIDGSRCGGGLQWGHFIARKKSPYMIYAVGNSFLQCQNHNLLEHWGDDVFSVWYGKTFGAAAHEAIWREARLHVGKKPQLWELEDWINKIIYLLDDRPAVYTMPLLIERGYFGEWPMKG